MECRILFHDSSFERVDWCKLDPQSGEVVESGVSDSEKLIEICSGSSKVIVYIPQQLVSLFSPKLPPRASKQQINSIAFSVEELLAEDIEDCFFAVLTQQPDQTVPVAVINQQIMDNLVQILSQQHINARLILPQIYLSPWSDEEDLLATITAVEQGFLIRTARHAGIVCQQNMLNQMLSLLANGNSTTRNRVVIYDENVLTGIEPGKLVVEKQLKLNLLTQKIDDHSVINLKQKDYESSHQWLGVLKQWKWAMVAMLLLTVAYISGTVVDGWQKAKTYSEIISQQQNLLSQYLPQLEITDQPKKQLIKILADSQGNAGQVGFLDLLHEYSRLKTGFSTVNTEKILFQKSRLLVNLETADLNSMESFRVQLEKSEFRVDIENVNISPDKTTGRLVMRDNI